MPEVAEGLAKLNEMMGQMPGNQAQPKIPGVNPGDTVQVVINFILSCAWPTVLLILLSTKDAKEAFGAGGDGSSTGGGGDTGSSPRITLVPR
jgi:hypothetical protein